MTDGDKQVLMDSLTEQQRAGIAAIIRDATVEGDWCRIGCDSVFEEDAAATLNSLAAYFEHYDPESALD